MSEVSYIVTISSIIAIQVCRLTLMHCHADRCGSEYILLGIHQLKLSFV